MTFLLSLLGWGRSLLAILAKVPWWIYAAAFLLFIGWRVHSGIEHRAHDEAYNAGFNRAWSSQQAKLDVQTRSIARLQSAIDEQNAASDARARAYADSAAQNARDVAAADQRAKATANRIALLQGIADHASANPTCKAPDALVAALEGV